MPTLWLKVLNKHSIRHIMYIEMEILSVIKIYKKKKKKKLTVTHNVDRDYLINRRSSEIQGTALRHGAVYIGPCLWV